MPYPKLYASSWLHVGSRGRAAMIVLLGLLWVMLIGEISSAQSVRIKRYGVEDGLLSDLTKNIGRDSLGFVWLGSDEGIMRLNGPSVEDYSYLVPSQYIKGVYAKGAEVFVVSDGGLTVLHSTWDTVTVRLQVNSTGELSDSTLNWPKQFYLDRKNRIWIGEGNAARVEPDGSVKRYIIDPPYNESSFVRAFSFSEDGMGTLWGFSYAGQLFYYREEADRFSFVEHAQVFDKINDVERVSRGVFLLACNNGLFEAVVSEEHELLRYKQLSNIQNVSTVEVLGSKAYFGTFGNGFYQAKLTEKGAFVPQRLDEISSDIQDIYIDEQENVWIASMSGAYLMQQSFFGALEGINGYTNGLSVSEYGHVFATDGGEIIESVPSEGGDYKKVKAWREELAQSISDFPDKGIMSVAVTNHNLWVGDVNGNLFYYCLDKEHPCGIVENSKVGESVFYLYADHQQNVWSCHDQFAGVVKTNEEHQATVYQEGLDSRIVVVKQRGGKDVFLGGITKGKYLFRYDSKTDSFENLSKPLSEEIPSLLVNDIAFGEKDTIWLANSETGLAYWTKDGVGVPQWLSDFDVESVRAIASTKSGALWVGYKLGVLRYYRGNITFFNQKNGLPSSALNYRTLKGDKEESLLFGTIKGVAYPQHPEILEQKTPMPRLADMRVNGKPWRPMPGEENVFENGSYLEATPIAMVYPSNETVYQMRMNAEAWMPVEETKLALYQLSPGKYVLEIRARQDGGRQWSNPYSFTFSIAWPWYRTWWGYILLSLAILLILYVVVRLNTYRLEKEKERLEKIIQDRTKEIWEQKDALEQQKEEIEKKNTALQQQKEEIQTQNEELFQLAEEISSQRDKIELQHKDLEKAYLTTQVVSEMGKEITATLSFEELLASIYNKLNQQLDAEVLAIGVLSPEDNSLDFSWVKRGEEKIGQSYDRLSESEKLSVYCFNHQEAVVINDFSKDIGKYIPAEKAVPSKYLSHVYLPLVAQGKKLGVITVQSHRKNVYKAQQLTLLEALAAYIATALDNSQAYGIISTKNSLITDSIRYAQQIQQAILPTEKRLNAAFAEHFIIFEPKDIVSGDFYWMAQVESTSPPIQLVATVDCTGHGVPGAFMSMIGSRILNEVVYEKGLVLPSEVLEMADQSVRVALKQDRGVEEAIKDGMEMTLCKIEQREESFVVTYSGAGAALFYKRTGGEVTRLRGSRRGIGGTGVHAEPFKDIELSFRKGDCLYLLTDGVVDQGNRDRKKFGTPRIMAMIKECAHLPMSEQKDIIEQQMEAFRQETEVRDDLTFWGIRF